MPKSTSKPVRAAQIVPTEAIQDFVVASAALLQRASDVPIFLGYKLRVVDALRHARAGT